MKAMLEVANAPLATQKSSAAAVTIRPARCARFGRVAYERLAEYWPTAASHPEASARHLEAGRLMNEIPKYVVSNHLKRLEWQSSHIVKGNIAAQITARISRKGASDSDVGNVQDNRHVGGTMRP
jgi:hypothetical protein